ncbi:MAG: tRNA (N6-threonylcarbamoyladenosine(37)-N6)-methyltransferase TrmO [Proteobacteria bacterium]|nr:tRNA (N6-threonylcarbamoyladenosine(37)-N6)-methyltransferase TrmO [Pseudomonadota bacterium]
MKIELEPVAYVRGGRVEVSDDDWGEVLADIEMDDNRFTPEAIAGLDAFSHLVVVYYLHKVDPCTIELTVRHPRENPAWPKIGIFAQRGKNRPNLLGVSTCQILGIDGLRIHVQGLDAVDGTPVLDLKPHMTGFEPRGEIHEPEWAREIMSKYW